MNDNNQEPQLSHRLKVFIFIGTVIFVGFCIFYFTTHRGDNEFTRTQIEPDSTLADKELIVKQDTSRKDTASADSANKEEEEQAKKVFNSIRGNNIHKVDSISVDKTEDKAEADESSKSGEASGKETEKAKPSTPSTTKSEQKPDIESIE